MGTTVHQLSPLLYPHEKEIMIKRLGPRKRALSSGICQLLISDQNTGKWSVYSTGIVCMVKDFERKWNVIQFFDLSGQILLEQRIYRNFPLYWHESYERLLQFEGEEHVYGLNFCKVEEADGFKRALMALAERRQQRQNCQGSTKMPVQAASPSTQTKTGTMKQKNKKLTRADISLPVKSSFCHLTHVDITPEKCFVKDAARAVAKLDPKIQMILESIGESVEQMNIEEQAFVTDWVEKQGGLGNLPNCNLSSTFRPPSSNETSTIRWKSQGNRTSQYSDKDYFYSSIPRARMACAPPAPPPPLTSSPTVAPTVPPPPPPPPLPSFESGNVLEQVNPASSAGGGARADLLTQIQQGKQLRPIGPAEQPSKTTRTGGGIAVALAKALADRRTHMEQGDTESEEEDTSDDADWDE